MAVQKFHSIEEMNAARVLSSTGSVDRFFRHCARYWALAPRTFPRGVFRFRNIAEAQDARRVIQQLGAPGAVSAAARSR